MNAELNGLAVCRHLRRLALRASTVEFQLVTLDFEAAFGFQALGEGNDVAAVEILDLAALLADKVVVMRTIVRLLTLVTAVSLPEFDATCQPEIDQEIGEPVDSDDINRVVLCGRARSRVGIDRAVHLRDR